MNTIFSESAIIQHYNDAKEQYRQYGIDTDKVLKLLSTVPVSVHCWQGDDCAGFEGEDEITGGGILATGNYPGRARNGNELRMDFEKAMSMIPGTLRFNIHAMHREAETNIERDEIEIEHFQSWIEWAKNLDIALDFNPTYFSHPKAAAGFTLSSKDADIRQFWIEHGKRSRKIAHQIGKALGKQCVNNFWIPDGSKDYPVDRYGHRVILRDALDEIFEEKYPAEYSSDAVESKLFGIGSEAYVVGSHEFYLGYALSRNIMLTMDAGHYHPTENIADKLSALLPFMDHLLLHVSRTMSWDSDHVVLFDDANRAIAQEITRAVAFDKVNIALDFFDASINRISAWVIGTRATEKSLLYALLEPKELLLKEETSGNLGNRLALLEELKTLPFSAVWNKYCLDQNVPIGTSWLAEVEKYEKSELLKR